MKSECTANLVEFSINGIRGVTCAGR